MSQLVSINIYSSNYSKFPVRVEFLSVEIAKFVIILSQKKCIRQASPTGPSESSAGISPPPQGEHTKLKECLLASNFSTFRGILRLTSPWTWCQSRYATLRLPGLLSSAASSAGGCSVLPLCSGEQSGV